jgi:histidinol-phosphate aminotransferase
MIAPRAGILETALAVHGGRRALAGEAAAVRYDFSVCLNAFGPADVVRRAVALATIDEYPDPEYRAPRAAASAQWHCPIDEIAFGAGAAEFIHAVCIAYLDPGDVVVIAAPSFGEYERAVRLRGAEPRLVWSEAGGTNSDRFAALRAAIEQVSPRLVVLCAPTTPTGASISQTDIRAIADTCQAGDSLLVLDQAYDAFAERPLGTPAIGGHPAVLHLRSLTKEHALAGLRVGFAIGPAPVIESLNRVRVPWSASSSAQAAAVAAMTTPASEHVAQTVSVLRANAARLQESSARLGFSSCPSTTHYFILHVRDAPSVCRILLDRAGICVRDCTSFGLPTHVRIAARTTPENDALLRALGMSDLDRYRTLDHTSTSLEMRIHG